MGSGISYTTLFVPSPWPFTNLDPVNLYECQGDNYVNCALKQFVFLKLKFASVKVGDKYLVHGKIYSQSKSSVHDKLHELHSHFPTISQRTPSIITSSCWKSTVSDVMASGIDRKKGRVQDVTCSLALTIRNLYDYKTKEYVVLISQSLSFWFQHQNLLLKLLFYKLKVAVILNSYSFLIDWANEPVMFWTCLFFFYQYRMPQRL